MKATIIRKYGKLDNVEFINVDIPDATENQIVIKMKAASINPVDWKIINGDLKPVLSLPFPLFLGSDGSGVVDKVGDNVTKFKVGDEVYFRSEISKMGTYAEYFSIDENLAAIKPKNMSFVEAASIPLVGLTSYQALKTLAKIKEKNKVFIHAGAGGVGTFAVQFAKYCGAQVATTASEKRFDLLNELGADEIIDYKQSQFENDLHDYDIVFDTLGGAYESKSYQILKKEGVLVSIIGIPDAAALSKLNANAMIKFVSFIAHKIKSFKIKKAQINYKYLFMSPSGEQLSEITDIIEAGKIKAVIDSVYKLEELKAAFEKSRKGHSVGKIIIEI